MSENKRGGGPPRPPRRRGRGRSFEGSGDRERRPQRDESMNSEMDAPSDFNDSEDEFDQRSMGLGVDDREDFPLPPRGTGELDWMSEYTLIAYFDRGKRQVCASVLEIPNLQHAAETLREASEQLQDKLELHLQTLKRQGDPLPPPIYSKNYPETVELKLSRGLQRRLDLLSRAERVSLEQLLAEYLAGATEKRMPSGGNKQGNRPQNAQQPRHSHNRHGGGGHSKRGRGYNESLESRENFMEYVRNLEKSGGGNRWKK